MTKFLAAMATAMLIDDRKIPSLDEPLVTWFPEWSDGRKAKVKLRHILAHTSGIKNPKGADELNRQDD